MPELLADEPLLLDALREGDSAGGADLAVAAAAAVAASPGGGPGGAVAGRAQLARAAASAGGQLSKLLYLTEHLLALLYTHLRLCLPAPALGAASPDKGLLAVAANGGGVEGGPGLQALGSERVSRECSVVLLPPCFFVRDGSRHWLGRPSRPDAHCGLHSCVLCTWRPLSATMGPLLPADQSDGLNMMACMPSSACITRASQQTVLCLPYNLLIL